MVVMTSTISTISRTLEIANCRLRENVLVVIALFGLILSVSFNPGLSPHPGPCHGQGQGEVQIQAHVHLELRSRTWT